MSMESQQTKEDQLQTPEPERPDNRMQAQTELNAIANLKLFTGLCARDDDVFGWQTRARRPPDT